MKNNLLFPLLQKMSGAALCLGIAGCGIVKGIPGEQRVRRAPTSQAETGVLVSIPTANVNPAAHAEQAIELENQVGDILRGDSELSARSIAPGLIEVYGLSAEEVQSRLGRQDVAVQQNKFVKFKPLKPLNADFGSAANASPSNASTQDAPTAPGNQEEFFLDPNFFEPPPQHPLIEAIQKVQGVNLDAKSKEFIGTCKLNLLLAPTIEVEANHGRDKAGASIFFDIKNSLKINAKKSTFKGTAKSLTFAWLITPAARSLLQPQYTYADTAEYRSDSTGMHIYSVVAKDDQGYCQLDIKPFYVTANDAFAPQNPLPDSDSQNANPETFWHLQHVGARATWAQSTGEGVTVGIIDSGVDYNHPALANNIAVNTKEIPGNQVDDDGNGFVDDYAGYDFGQDDSSPYDDYGHGTHVAGIAASNIFGAARKAQILPIKMGSGLGFDVGSVAGAIRYAVDRNAKVLNMSFGWDEDFAAVRDAITYAETKNVLVVAAAGNDTANNDSTPSFPCNYANKNVISIAATDEFNHLTSYSNFGKKVHLGAPGGTRQKPIVSSYKKNPRGNEYAGLMGTSMASPLVAGVAAQVWAVNKQLTAVQVRQILLDTGVSVDTLQGRIASGKVVDAKAAVAAALATRAPVEPNVMPTPVAPELALATQ